MAAHFLLATPNWSERCLAREILSVRPRTALMKALTKLSALAALLLMSAPLAAQETEAMQLEFLRKLRAKGYSDLAMQYLDHLKQQKPSPAFAAQISLESARTQVSLARH